MEPKDQIEEGIQDLYEDEELIAQMFWGLNRGNRRKVLKKEAKWGYHVGKVTSKKFKKNKETEE